MLKSSLKWIKQGKNTCDNNKASFFVSTDPRQKKKPSSVDGNDVKGGKVKEDGQTVCFASHHRTSHDTLCKANNASIRKVVVERYLF